MPKRRANGEGNIRKRKDGRWEGRYTVGHDPETGKAIIKNVLGNLMDNAIEACRRLPEGTPRRITAHGRVNGGFLVLRVQNPVSGEENNIPVGGALLDHHGWGLSIVRQIAERRGGRLTTERSDGRFISTVWISAAE